MPRAESIALIDEYWRRRFACTEEELAADSTIIRNFPADPSHRFNVIAVHRLDGGCVINVHDHRLPSLEHLKGAAATRSFDQQTLCDAYESKQIELAITAYQAYADGSDLRVQMASVPVQPLDKDDPAIARLRSAISDADWNEASMPEAESPVLGAYVGNELAAVAHAPDRGGIRHMGILTSPDHRRRGYARAAAYALARELVDRGEIVEWQARSTNAASLAIRDALGFVERYRTITLRVSARA